MIRTYSELIRIPTFEDRFRYLQLHGAVGKDTFGFDRYLNQQFYRSKEWRELRRQIILRDNCCDLGDLEHEIFERPIVHHMNPILVKDLSEMTEYVMNPEYLVTTTHRTHNAIHYGDESVLENGFANRSMNDTCPWKL